MTSQHGKQTIAIHILPTITRSEDNQTLKFGQLMEYDKLNAIQIYCNKLLTTCFYLIQNFSEKNISEFYQRILKLT